jgi:putative ABC transport system permease protein
MTLREMLARLRDRLRRDALSAELDEELRMHRELLARDVAAHDRTFGNVTYYKEEARAMWSLGLVDDLLHDIRYAARVLRRDLGFTAAVVVTLALGIGANTAVFSIVNAVLLRELPYADPDRLVSVWTSQTSDPTQRNPTSLPDVRDWQRDANVFSGVAGLAFNRFDVTGPEGDTQLRAAMGTGNLYDVLGARPILGRMPRRDEEMLPVTTISYRVWQERFGGSPDVIGRPIKLSGIPFTIVGVMPRGFQFPSPDIDLWTTLHTLGAWPDERGETPWITSRSLRGFRVVARLAPNVTITRAERAMNAIEHRLGEAYPTIDAGIDVHLQSVREDALGKVQRGLWTVFGAAGLILLLACVNVAHLLLARLSTRERELAVRRALGAHRGRVARQLITESVLLGLVGGVAGVAAAFVAKRALLAFAPADMPRLENVAIDAQSLAFAFVLSIATGLVFGVAPAVLGWGREAHESLRAQGRGTSGGIHGGRTRAMLTAVEVAFAVVLLVGAGLMLRSFSVLTSTDLGIQPEQVTVAQVTMVGPRYQSAEAKDRALTAVLENIRAIPGVAAAGASTSLPPTRIQEAEGFDIVGKPPAQPGHERIAIFIPTTTQFLEALRMPIMRGRSFDARDNAASPKTVLVSAELVRLYFPKEDPVGKQIQVNNETRAIVGVVGDAVYEGVGSAVKPVIYVPYSQFPFAGVWVVIRSTLPADALNASIRDAIHRVDPEMPAHRAIALSSVVADAVVRPRFNAWLLSTFGGLALLLASIGIYSVIAYGVTQRRPEIGIRLALGAPRLSVVMMVLRAGMAPVVVGIAIGVVVARIGSRIVAGLLYGVAPTDAITFAGVSIVLALAGAAAAYIPARRASRVDPVGAMRVG